MKDTSATGQSTAQFSLLENLLGRARTKAHLTGFPWEHCSVIFWDLMDLSEVLDLLGLYQSSLLTGYIVQWPSSKLRRMFFFATWRKFCSSWCHWGRTPCQCCTPRSGENIVLRVQFMQVHRVYLTTDKLGRSWGMPNIYKCEHVRTCKGQRPLKPMGFGSSAEVQKTQ